MPMPGRWDLILVWPHFLDDSQLDALLYDLHFKRDKFRICGMWHRDILTMPRFVRAVYDLSDFPADHLQAKVRMLDGAEPRVFAMLVRNLDPQDSLHGSPPYQVMQSKAMVTWKTYFRNRFNPKNDDNTPSDRHVLHTSDCEEEARVLMRMLGLRDPDWYVRRQDDEVACSAWLPEFTWEPVTLSLPGICMRQMRPDQSLEILPVRKSVIYRYLTAQTSEEVSNTTVEHLAYWHATRGRQCCAEHSPWGFEQMAKEWQPSGTLKDAIVVDPEGVIVDGAHRASILLSRGITSIQGVKATWSPSSPT